MTFHGLGGFSVRLYVARAGEFALCWVHCGFAVCTGVCVCDGSLRQLFMVWEQKVTESIIRWIQPRGVLWKAFWAENHQCLGSSEGWQPQKQPSKLSVVSNENAV